MDEQKKFQSILPRYSFQLASIFLLVLYFCAWFFWSTQIKKNNPEHLIENFPFEKQQAIQAISDYGKLYSSVANFYQVEPKSIQDAQTIVKLAYESNTALRIRGSGHNAAGMSLPSEQEILLSTRGLTHFRLEEVGTVTFGTGVSMWEARDFVQALGYQLPVFPDDQGPTVGGYIAVGGIGVGAAEFGGFWENVKSLTLITGTGELKTIESNDEIFPWIFGANGQLGLVVEAKLKVLGADNASQYDLDTSGDVFEYIHRYVPQNDLFQAQDNQLFFFQYLFAAKHQHIQALQDIQTLMSKYNQGFHYLPIDQLVIKHKSIMAPLVYKYPLTEANPDYIMALGIRALAQLSTVEDKQRMIAYGNDFRKLALAKGYKIYLQHDARYLTVDYASYYGSHVYEQFLQYKKQYDPKNILNPASVFPLVD